MSNFVSEMERKIKLRNEAKKNKGINTSNEDRAVNSYSILQQQLNDAIDQAIESKDVSYYSALSAHGKRLGTVTILLKRVIRKLFKVFFGWLIFPMINKQSNYNGKVTNAIKLESYVSAMQERRLNELENVCNKLMGDNIQLADVKSIQEERLSKLENTCSRLMEDNILLLDIKRKMDYILQKMNINCDLALLENNDIDYLRFENSFRGSRESVKLIQKQYLHYYTHNGGGNIVDIGSGRGEFLELMKDQNIPAYGVDNYEPFVSYCLERGYSVIKGDALTHIHSLEDNSLGGIFMSQVVEHLSEDYIKALIKIAYKKLKAGCYFIMETPNPECLATLTEFNIDMTHIKPIHYKALEFLFREAKYQSVEKHYSEQTLYPVSAPLIDGDGINNKDYFNNGIEQINKLLFGYRDYTLIARK